MNDLIDLHDAFTELERRADTHTQTALAVRPAAGSTVRPRSERLLARRRPVLVGATVAALLAAVTGAVVVTTRPDHTAAPAGTSAPVTSASQPAVSSSAPTAAPVRVATTTADLAVRFRAVLGDVATFTVTSTNDPLGDPAASTAPTGSAGTPSTPITSSTPTTPGAPVTGAPVTDPSVDDVHDVQIIGVLTAAGVSGGYDVQTLQTTFGPAQCEQDFGCTVSTLADGSSLAVGTTSILSADGTEGAGVTHEAVLVRPDGVEVILHVSNERDPKGMSEIIAPAPPLTTAQMTTIVTSPLWVTA